MTYTGSDVTRVLGFIPARMKSFRFPGKPLAEIAGKPMLEHVVERAAQYEHFGALYVAMCDQEIEDFCAAKGYARHWTDPHHTRALDRVAEAAEWYGAEPNDIVVCVQGDEPMLTPDMIAAVVDAVDAGPALASVLAVPITDYIQWGDPDTVKIITTMNDFVVYTSREAIPWIEGHWWEGVESHRVGGIFAFRASMLRWFAKAKPGPLEYYEHCDINRFMDHGMPLQAAKIKSVPYISVDRPEDIQKVEAAWAMMAS